MNNRRWTSGFLLWLTLTGAVACQSRTKPAEQSTTVRPDTTVFDDDTLEGAIRDSVRRPTTHKH